MKENEYLYVSVSEQQDKCLRGEHEGEPGFKWAGYLDVRMCKHCRCLYVAK